MMNESDNNIDQSESVMQEGYGLNGADNGSSSSGTDDDDDDNDDDAPFAVAKEGNFDDEIGMEVVVGDDEDEKASSSETNGTYPADCYSFLALHGPIKNPTFFAFGFTVWMFQVRSETKRNENGPFVSFFVL